MSNGEDMAVKQNIVSIRASLMFFLVTFLVISCSSSSLSLQESLRRGYSLESLSELSDREFAVQLAETLQGNLLNDESGVAARMRLHEYLVRRLRGRYRHIPEPLWRHLTTGDLTVLFGNPEEQSPQKEPGVLRRLFSNPQAVEQGRGHPRPHEEGEPQDRFPDAVYKMDGDAVQVNGGSVVICGQTVEVPPLRYLPPRSGESLATMTESVLASRLGRSVSLGTPIAEGGMRLIYSFPGNPSLLLKIYDPARIDRIRAEGGIKAPTAVLLAFFLQRDLAVMDILAALRQKYLAQGMLPPYELAELEKDPQLLERGIVVQPKISGLSVWKDLPEQLNRSSLDLLDRFFQFHEYFDRPVALFVRNRYDIFLFVQPAENEKNIKVGIDYGRKYSNFFLQKNPARLIIYDW